MRREQELKLGTKMQGFLPWDEQKGHSAPRSLPAMLPPLASPSSPKINIWADAPQHMQILHSSTSVIVTEPSSSLTLPLELLQTQH